MLSVTCRFARFMLLATTVAVATLAAPASASGTGSPARACAQLLHTSPARCAQLLRTPQRTHTSWMSPAAASSDELAYDSEPLNNVVNVVGVSKTGLSAVGQIALKTNSFPIGMTVVSGRNLFVAITAFLGPPAVPSGEEFPQGATQPSTTYTAGLSAPFDVAVDRKGTLYVADVINLSSGCMQAPYEGQVVEYAKGKTQPKATIHDFDGCIGGIAIDRHGNLYLSYYYYPASGTVVSDVREYSPGSTKGQELNLQVPNGPLLGGIQFDAKNDLLVENTQADGTLYQILTYPQGQTSPSATLQYGSLDGWDSSHFALHGSQLFAPAYVALNFGSVLAQIDYPSGTEAFALSPAQAAPTVVFGFAVTQ